MAPKPKISLRLFATGDELSVGNLLTVAYDSPGEARLVSALRARGDFAVELLGFVTEKGNEKLIGYIGFSRHVSPKDWLALSSIAVLPQYQGVGLGSDMIRYGLDHARRAGAKAVTVLGDGRYYQRFGFTYNAAKNLRTPYAHSKTLLYPIAPGTAFAEVTLAYSPAFDRVGG